MNNNEIKPLTVKKRNIILRLKIRLRGLFRLIGGKQKNDVKNERRPLNLKTLVMSYPEFKGMTEEEIYNLIDEKNKEYEEIRKFEEENGETFDEFIKETNERLNCSFLNDIYEDEYGFAEVYGFEEDDNQLSTSDLLKELLRLKSEVDTKMEELYIEKMKSDNEIEQLEKEVAELEKELEDKLENKTNKKP